jgi:type II secretory pathway component GspD/PulD (secretin)
VLPGIRFTNASLRDILSSIGMSAGINVTFDNTFQDRQYSVQMDNSTLEEALSQITASNQLFYKVQSPRIIIVVPTTCRSARSTKSRSFARSSSRTPTRRSWPRR